MKKLPLAATLTMTLWGCVGAPPDDADTAALAITASSLPRMVAPLHGAVLGTQRPVFRVEGPVRAGARLELCADRGCAVVEQSTPYYAAAIRAVGTLSPGLHFWRVADGPGASTAWAFYVPNHDSNESATTAYNADFNGDGLPEYATKESRATTSAAVFVQGPEGTPYSTLAQRVPERPDALGTLGDVNGDGFTDLTASIVEAGGRVVAVYFGSPRGPERRQSLALTGNVRLRGVGDVNRDGYADALLDTLGAAIPDTRDGGIVSSALHLGGPDGLAATPTRGWDCPVYPAGDVNGDGFADLRVNATLPSGGLYLDFYLGARDLTAMRQRAIRPPTGQVFGHAETAVGDLNGDGLNDVVVFIDGRISLYFPTTAGFRAVPDQQLGSLPVTRWNDRDFYFLPPTGRFLRGVGDVDGDGFDDLAVLVRGYAIGSQLERQFLWRIDGRVDGVATPALQRSTSYYPGYLHRVGDLDDDGLDDIRVVGGDASNGGSTGNLAFAASL